ncbi:MAG: peroxisomal assembly protein [Alectoria sarmentosa]|nr:MAG: peroxisomal assembly protein [Alectoria sarmentosa]
MNLGPILEKWHLGRIKGNVGNISRDLYTDLFPHKPLHEEPTGPSTTLQYIAITPWTPSSQDLVQDATWTILPVRAQGAIAEGTDGLGPSTIQFPATSLALQTFAEALKAASLGKGNVKGKAGVEIRMLEVEPLRLDRVYVTVDGIALNKHEEVQKKFGGGFPGSQAIGYASKSKGKGKGKASVHDRVNVNGGRSQAKEQEERLTAAIREGLASSLVVRQNDLLPLPLPSHPITHVPLPPAKITFCEPVSQGLLSNETKIIVNRVYHSDPAVRAQQNLAAHNPFRAMAVENGNNTSNEQFSSAVEDGENDDSVNVVEMESTSGSESSDKESDSSSGDSMDNIISMNAPRLANPSSGILSSRTVATPRVRKSTTNGISTPGSVLSNFTSTTARQSSRAKSRLFKAQALRGRIPDDLLHPKPDPDEDDEARVFVDIKTLLKLSCFSGDWVKLVKTSAPSEGRSELWGIEAFDHENGPDEFRPVKIYGLPDLSPVSAPRYAKGSALNGRTSVAVAQTPDTRGLVAWLSPVLLANIGQTQFVKLSSLLVGSTENSGPHTTTKTSKVSSSASPVVAKELTILRVSTPLSTERALQSGIFASLKQHFERKRRILRQGDLIALPIDVCASRLLAQPAGGVDADLDIEECLALSMEDKPSTVHSLEVAWFKVGHIVASEHDDNRHPLSPVSWGGAACIEPMNTRMRQAGSETCKTPSALNASWKSYLGAQPPMKASIPYNPVKQSVASIPKPYIAPLQRRLRELLAAATSPRAVHLGMDPMIILLNSTQRNIGKATLASNATSDLGLHIFDIDAYDLVAEGGSGGDVKTEALFKARVERALTCGADCTVILVRHVEALTADRMTAAIKDTIPDVRVLIATTTEIENIPDSVRSLFTHELEIVAPDEGEREGTLRGIVEDRAIRLGHNVDLASIAVKTAALVAGNLVDIVDRAVVARQDRLEKLVTKGSLETERTHLLVRDVIVSGGEDVRCVTKVDFDLAVEAARNNFADAIGAPKIPNVSWDDVGGLTNVKDAVMETIQLPLERPELFAKGMKKRSGILFYGPPGTGKTLLAKAIATEFSLNFFSVKGPELLNMYIGESEANVRRVFQRARDARPCVVFFDELDSVAPKRGNQGDSGGVMDRIVSQLLAELDGMSDGEEGGGGVFVIGATNRPDLLDQALLRPGRFDKMLYLGVSDTHDKQRTILEALTRKFAMHPEMSLRRVAESLPFTYTGADLYALCSDAMLKAITRQALAVDVKIKALSGAPVTTAYFFDHLATDEDIAVLVTEEDFFAANRELVGSVSAKELEHYQRVRHAFEGPTNAQKAPNITAASRIPAPITNEYLQPPASGNRPKPVSRIGTAKQADPKGKGKGKATQWDSDDDDDDDAYVTSNDFAGTPDRKRNGVNGFGDVGGNDDEEIYG